MNPWLWWLVMIIAPLADGVTSSVGSRTAHLRRDRAVAYLGIFVELVAGALRNGDFFSHLRVTQHREQYGTAKDVAAQGR